MNKDSLGNPVEAGMYVVYSDSYSGYLQLGRIKRMTPKGATIEFVAQYRSSSQSKVIYNINSIFRPFAKFTAYYGNTDSIREQFLKAEQQETLK